jgi:hypothetical protein
MNEEAFSSLWIAALLLQSDRSQFVIVLDCRSASHTADHPLDSRRGGQQIRLRRRPRRAAGWDVSPVHLGNERRSEMDQDPPRSLDQPRRHCVHEAIDTGRIHRRFHWR